MAGRKGGGQYAFGLHLTQHGRDVGNELFLAADDAREVENLVLLNVRIGDMTDEFGVALDQ
jgi:hypothetical protein